MAISEFIKAIIEDDGNEISNIITNTPEVCDMHDPESGLSPLMVAIYHQNRAAIETIRVIKPQLNIWEACALGDLETIRALHGKHKNVIELQAVDGFFPLGLAAFFGHTTCVLYLVDAGADVNRVSRNELNLYPVHNAAAFRDPAVGMENLKILLKAGADTKVKQAGGWTPLHQAAAHGHEGMARLLLQHGAIPDALSDTGKTPAEIARERGNSALAELLSR
jgi:ankyrin repeat protein